MSPRRFGPIPIRSAFVVALSLLLFGTLSIATKIPDQTPGWKLLQNGTINLLMEMDRALAPECQQRTIVDAAVIRPPDLTSLPGEVELTRPWQERWYLDRCGDVVAWNVRYEPFDLGGTGIAVGLAAQGENASAASPGLNEGPVKIAVGPNSDRLEVAPGGGIDTGSHGESDPASLIAPSNHATRATFFVTTAIDGGPGSLAQAIIDANASPNRDGPDVILFKIPGPGSHRISLISALPTVTDPVVIDGYSQPGSIPNSLPDTSNALLMVELDGSRLTRPAHGLLLLAGSTIIRGLRIQGFDGDGIRIEGNGSNRIEGNILGSEPGETSSFSNAGHGVAVFDSSDNVIGGSLPSARNVIEGNGKPGVLISGINSIGNAILGNGIVRNADEGIDRESDPTGGRTERGQGPNNLQHPPVLNSVSFSPAAAGHMAEVVVEGVLEGDPAKNYRVELFATSEHPSTTGNQPGGNQRDTRSLPEGERFLASMEVTIGADGKVGFQFHLPWGVHSRDSMTATATDPNGNTSEFSQPAVAPAFTIMWNTGSGMWGTAANWSPAVVPGSTDDVLIAENGTNTTFTVTLDVTDTVNSLTVGSGNGTQTLSVPGSTLTLKSASTVNTNGVLSQSGGFIAGAGDLTIDGSYNWSGGTMTGTGVTTVNGPLNLSGTTKALTGGRTLTLNNAATATWTAGNVSTVTGTAINNAGTWDVQSDVSIVGVPFQGAGTFTNSGTFRKSAGAGTTAVIPFTSSGSVEVQSGTVNFNGGGSNTGGLNISLVSGTLQFGGGTFELNAGTNFSGPGTVWLSTGTVNVNSAISTPTETAFRITGGVLGGTGTLTTMGPLNWSAGAMTGTGVTMVNGPLNLTGTTKALTGGRTLTLNNAATATWTAGNVSTVTGTAINNAGTWDAQSDAAITGVAFQGAGTLTNSGTFRKSAGTGTTAVSIPFTNSGIVDVQTGTLNVSSSNYTQTAGISKLTGGALSSTTSISVQGGTLGGSGMVTGPVVVSGSGALAPGLSPGILSLVGNYTQQGPNGAFNVEIGGSSPGQFDRADISGTGIATLAGALNVSLINSFPPASGNSFAIMTYLSHTGAFTPNLPPLSGCLGWQLNYGSTSVVLAAVTVPAEVTGLTFLADQAGLVWDAAPIRPGTMYDVLRGDLDKLPVGPGADETCLVQGITSTMTTDPVVPTLGHGFWYVVRERFADCGAGTYGFASNGTERMSVACP